MHANSSGQVSRWYWLWALVLWGLLQFGFSRWPVSSRQAWSVKHVCLYLILPLLFLMATRSHKFIQWRWSPKARRWTIICCAMVLPVYAVAALLPGMRAYYPMWPIDPGAGGVALYLASMLAIVGGTEFLYRGVMLLPMRGWGPWAVLPHLAPYVWIHVGKPPEEVLGSVLAGLLWGWAAYRSGTIYPGLISHGLGWVMLELVLAFGWVG